MSGVESRTRISHYLACAFVVRSRRRPGISTDAEDVIDSRIRKHLNHEFRGSFQLIFCTDCRVELIACQLSAHSHA